MIPTHRSAFIRCPIQLSSPPYLSRSSFRACATSPSLDRLLNTARRQLSPTGLQITSVDWQSRVLTLFVKRENGNAVSADDCADATTLVAELIEEGTYLGDAPYTLQVSTPGASDVLTQPHELEAFRGFPVHVKTTEMVNGKKEFWGTLADCDEHTVRMAQKGRLLEFKRQIVEQIRLCTAQQVQEASGK